MGKQDQYAAAFGGVNAFTFRRDGSVDVRRLELSADTRAALAQRFLLFFTGESRSASDMLAGQVQRSLSGDMELRTNLFRTEELARGVADVLEEGRLEMLGGLLSRLWALKRERQPLTATRRFDELRTAALEAGAETAMLLGAGGGGFVLAYAPEPDPVRSALESAGAPELTFGLDEDGCVAGVTAGRRGRSLPPPALAVTSGLVDAEDDDAEVVRRAVLVYPRRPGVEIPGRGEALDEIRRRRRRLPVRPRSACHRRSHARVSTKVPSPRSVPTATADSRLYTVLRRNADGRLPPSRSAVGTLPRVDSSTSAPVRPLSATSAPVRPPSATSAPLTAFGPIVGLG